jgi:hypothetical protein
MSEDIKKKLLIQTKFSPKFALQIDELTDVADLPQLLVFVRYCFEENIHEDFMFCQLLTEEVTHSRL